MWRRVVQFSHGRSNFHNWYLFVGISNDSNDVVRRTNIWCIHQYSRTRTQKHSIEIRWTWRIGPIIFHYCHRRSSSEIRICLFVQRHLREYIGIVAGRILRCHFNLFGDNRRTFCVSFLVRLNPKLQLMAFVDNLFFPHRILYFILKRNEKYTEAQKLEMEAVNETKQTASGETTHM